MAGMIFFRRIYGHLILTKLGIVCYNYNVVPSLAQCFCSGHAIEKEVAYGKSLYKSRSRRA